LNEFAEYLKSADLRFSGNQAVRAAEQLPLASVDAISRMKDGDSMISPNPAGLTVLFLVGSRSEPVDEARARPAIEAFLLNQRKAEAIQKDLKALRESSKIEYVGKFAQPAPGGAASAPVLPAASDAAAPVAPAASGLDAASISKGMGLK
ncbi:MAG: peptidyl-prolyl cis-trans isomerase, EpsD family, partial [Methylotenera sp.]|nr:peptidyl-prolyl cis-trans isomerase, EpsD family [Methylotenera sp.]